MRPIAFPPAACALILGQFARAIAGQSASQSTEPLSADWPLERVTLVDGRTLEGLVQAESAASIEFVEVRRPRGRPMSLVVWPLERERIKSWQRLDAPQQKELRARLERYKRRTLVEGRRAEDLHLAATSDDGQVSWNYQGNWFTLESTADEFMTRRLIVRLGQIFTAYRQLVPPRLAGARRVHIRVFGSTEQYQAALAELGLRFDNPAVYLADKNQILAGSELNRFDAELARVSKQHRQIRRELDALVADAPARVKELGEDLKRNNIPTAERLRILLAEQRKWDDLRKAAQRKIAALDRQNLARFHEVTGRMFTRLAHEAFHAYLETTVYPRRIYEVPRWLNEGLAQTFEAGLLEADSLRIDAPNQVALTQLQADLRGPDPLALADLLTATSADFLGVHDAQHSVSRAYYYSWGLAYYLAFELSVLSSEAFDEYLSPTAGTKPVERFEALVGQPLPEFEKRWREAMLAMKAGP
jgi:hypothetical protein